MIPLTLHHKTLEPLEVIKNYTSLTWNERYSRPDEFKLVTSNIEETLFQLPHDTFISLQDTERFMIVENHEISRNSEGGYALTVSGYGFEGFYKHRVITRKHIYSKEWRIDTHPDVIVMTILTENVSGRALAVEQQTDEYVVTSEVTRGPTVKRVVGEGELEPVINELLESYNLGMRSRRTPSGQVFQGLPTVIVHQGIDRTLNNFYDETPVVFSAFNGGVSDDSYINSTADLKNAIYQVQYDNDDGSSRDDWYIKSIHRGIGTKVAFLSTDWHDWSHERESQRKETFRRHGQDVIFQGTMAMPPGVEYGQNIFIGDLVSVQGSYGFNETMRLTEFTRIEDAEGERSYPTLTKDKELPDE